MNGNDPWAGILDHDETILWQGQPAPGVRNEWDSPFQPFFFLFFTGFSIFWMLMASAAGGFFWTFGLLFFGVGLYNFVGVHFWKARLRRNTFYTLTNKRALIGTSRRGRRQLDSYPITAQSQLQFVDGKFDDIWFEETQGYSNKRPTRLKVGFERLKDGRDVYAKLREIQRGIG